MSFQRKRYLKEQERLERANEYADEVAELALKDRFSKPILVLIDNEMVEIDISKCKTLWDIRLRVLEHLML